MNTGQLEIATAADVGLWIRIKAVCERAQRGEDR